MTHLAFDATALDGGPSGTETRLTLIVPELVRRGVTVSVVHRPELDAAVRAILGGARLIERADAPTGPLARALRRGWFDRAVVDVVRADRYFVETWPMPARADVVPVIHDLRHLRSAGWRRVLFRRWLHQAAGRARLVHVVSATVRAELVREVPALAGRIEVVPNAVRIPAVARPTDLPVSGPFVLAVGHAESRKNWALIDALATALATEGVAVVRVGRPGGVGHAKVRDLGPLDDQTRDAVMQSCRALVAPSLLEGFGLVPLEGLAAGAWVVASDIPAHREVLGLAADYADARDPAAMLALVRRAVWATDAERAARAVLARRRALDFSAPRAVDALLRSLTAHGM